MALPLVVRRAIDFIRGRKVDYQLVFGSPAGQRVLADLAFFCRADRTCFDADPRLHAVAEGRREVFLRIQQHLRFTPEQLYMIFDGRTVLPDTDDGDAHDEG